MLSCLQATGVMLEGLHDIIISLFSKARKTMSFQSPISTFFVCLLTVHEFHNFKTLEMDSNSLFRSSCKMNCNVALSHHFVQACVRAFFSTASIALMPETSASKLLHTGQQTLCFFFRNSQFRSAVKLMDSPAPPHNCRSVHRL